jgi:spore coat polysaccharide biosynthesis predicted glycosyltransferase SpsG
MVNYGKTKIYKIWSPLGDKIYIGATTKDYLSKRMVEHRSSYNTYNELNKKINTSFLIFDEYGIENCFIELIESKECNSIEEQRQLEAHYIKSLNCVNKKISGRTKKEHYEDNKDEILIKQKQYYEENKNHVALRQNIKTTCVCGSEYRQCTKSRHERTNKHINFINQSILQQ